jgi:hypothetical protein
MPFITRPTTVRRRNDGNQASTRRAPTSATQCHAGAGHPLRDGVPDARGVERVVDYVLAGGVGALVALGGHGGGCTFGPRERAAVVEATITAAGASLCTRDSGVRGTVGGRGQRRDGLGSWRSTRVRPESWCCRTGQPSSRPERSWTWPARVCTISARSAPAVKIMNQMVVGTTTVVIAEAMVVGIKYGVDPRQAYEVLRSGFADSTLLQRHVPQFILGRQFSPGFALRLLAKDVNLACELGRQ